MRFSKQIITLLAAVMFQACALRTPDNPLPAVPGDECPVVLLTRTGGLGFESQSGVLAAVWRSGTILRVQSQVLANRYVIGTLPGEDLNELMQLAQSDRIWSEPPGIAALDTTDDVLTVRRGGGVRRWVETPGFTSTPAVAEIRAKLFALPIETPRRISGPPEGIRSCEPAETD